MGKLKVQLSADITAGVDRVWEILAQDFLNIADWARGVESSRDNPEATAVLEGAPAGGRYCDVKGLGKIDERIVHFDAEGHEITWTASASKLPDFVSGLQNAVTVKVLDANTTRVTSNISANLSGFMGIFMAPMMKRNLSKTIGGFLEDLDIYAVTGRISETKQRQLARSH